MTTIGDLKFACPVCHQHIVCDSGAIGSQIECPTCFRPIIVPKSANGTTSKLILCGAQPRIAHSRAATKIKAVSSPEKTQTLPVTVVAMGLLLLVASVVLVINR
jgi:hypothetical protein